MILNWYKSQCAGNPPILLDEESSKYTVFMRRNVVETKSADEMSGDEVITYDYEEAKISKEDYAQYHEDIAKDIALMETNHAVTDLDLANIVAEQALTDMDLRLVELESK